MRLGGGRGSLLSREENTANDGDSGEKIFKKKKREKKEEEECR